MRRGEDHRRAMRNHELLKTIEESPIVVIDACVWHSAFVRNVLRHVAIRGLIRPRWTVDIEAEWVRSIRRARHDIPIERLHELRDRLRSEFPEGLVRSATLSRAARTERWRGASTKLPDPDDAHVVLAAISCRANVICTVDRRGFPPLLLRPVGVVPMTPDALLHSLLAFKSIESIQALETHRQALRRPQLSRMRYLDAMWKSGLPASSSLAGALLSLTRPVRPSDDTNDLPSAGSRERTKDRNRNNPHGPAETTDSRMTSDNARGDRPGSETDEA